MYDLASFHLVHLRYLWHEAYNRGLCIVKLRPAQTTRPCHLSEYASQRQRTKDWATASARQDKALVALK